LPNLQDSWWVAIACFTGTGKISRAYSAKICTPEIDELIRSSHSNLFAFPPAKKATAIKEKP